MTEVWRPVPGYVGLYEASNLGRIRRTARVLSPKKVGRRYQVLLSGRGRPHMRLLHRVVAETFLGPCPEGMEVDHVDGSPTNNRIENLEYVMPLENVRRATQLGLRPSFAGRRNGRAKLTVAAVRAIRAARGQVRAEDLAKKYGVSPTAISFVWTRHTWADVA